MASVKEDLLEIWNLSFHDDRDYIENFLRYCATEENTVVARSPEGRVVSAAYLLDSQIIVRGKPYSALYFYAAATHPDYRKQGYMGKVIEDCLQLARDRDMDFVYLVPAEGALYRYYAKFGFRTCFYSRTVNFTYEELRAAVKDNSIADLKNGAVDPMQFSLTDITRVRESAMSGTDHVSLGYPQIQYALFEHAYCGGKIFCDGNSYALYSEENGTVDVKEICPPVLDGSMARALLELKAEKYRFHAPSDSGVEGRRKTVGRSGMAIALNKHARTATGQMQNAYIGITLG